MGKRASAGMASMMVFGVGTIAIARTRPIERKCQSCRMSEMARKKVTFEEKVWFFMRRLNRPVTTAEVQDKFRCSRVKASNALWRMIEVKGSAVRIGNGRGCRYMATRFQPFDQRGMSPKTHAALRAHSFPAFDDYWPRSKLNPANNNGASAYVGCSG